MLAHVSLWEDFDGDIEGVVAIQGVRFEQRFQQSGRRVDRLADQATVLCQGQ
jgi:hypothetical protein